MHYVTKSPGAATRTGLPAPAHLRPRRVLDDARELARFVGCYGRRFVFERLEEHRVAMTPAPHRPNPGQWCDTNLTIAWLGHATLLINFQGCWILTDPALRRRVGVRLGALTVGPRRLVAPPVLPHELPPLDLILISHSHMDHCDLGTLRRLPCDSRVVVQRRNRDLVRRFRLVDELDWGQDLFVDDLRIEAVPVRHWGARRLTDSYRGFGGFLLQRGGRTVLFAGDTAYTSAFAELGRRVPIDLAVLPIGGYDPYIYNHADPEQAWTMFREMGARWMLPIHHSTFRLSREPPLAPIAGLMAVAGADRDRIVVTEVGETWTLGPGLPTGDAEWGVRNDAPIGVGTIA
jgi:L-ascorbate metabolism protein UlaG (beta-lactamase superfamily)